MRNYYGIFQSASRIIAALVFCSLGISKALAQEGEREYVPFVEEGKVWYCGHAHSVDDSFPKRPEDPLGIGIDCIFTMFGDTLINGKEYKKVCCQYREFYGDEEQHYYCAVREESCQVFIIEEETTDEKLIYDFSLPEEFITLTYNDFRYVRTDGERRNDYFLPGQLGYVVCKFTEDGEVDFSNGPSYWIDGVGDAANNPFAFEFTFLFPSLGVYKLGKRITTITCIKDGKYIYNLAWMVEPGWPNSIDDCNHADNSNKEYHLYNLQGQRMDSTPHHGVYIRGGRKYVR